MLRRKSVQQILEVLDNTRSSYRAGVPIQRACQDAVRTVAKKHTVEYQTIHDGCCRRLALERINDFHVLVQKWLDGNPQPLKNLLLKKAGPNCHSDISQFFGGAGMQSMINDSSENGQNDEAMETFLVDLPRIEARMLRILCEVKEKSPSKLIYEILSTNVKKQLKPLLEEFISESKNSRPESSC